MPGAGAIELRGITKRFGEVIANDGIDLDLLPGRIQVLLGANGAGKTTLLNLLTRQQVPDGGQIRRDPGLRIGMVHQHFKLLDSFTVAENLALGHEPGRGPWLDRGAARARVRELEPALDPDAVVGELPVGTRQRVEIAKALAGGADWLLLDEPTAVLTPPEVEALFTRLRGLRDAGRGIVLITHRLAEARAIADLITVLRNGRVVGEFGAETAPEVLAAALVGETDPSRLASLAPQGPRLASLAPQGSGAGELVGVAGAPGNGQAEYVAELLASATGTVAYIPEDRNTDGYVADLPIASNLVLDQLDQFSRRGLLRRELITRTARQRAADYGIDTPVERPARVLSGGNQQRLVLARELSRPADLVVACEPTRGLDLAAVDLVHQRLVAARDAGAQVVLVSSDLDELLTLADRILVCYGGEIVADLPADTPREQIGLLMAQGRP